MMRRLYVMRVSFEIPSGFDRNSLLWFCGLQQRFFFSGRDARNPENIRLCCLPLLQPFAQKEGAKIRDSIKPSIVANVVATEFHTP